MIVPNADKNIDQYMQAIQVKNMNLFFQLQFQISIINLWYSKGKKQFPTVQWQTFEYYFVISIFR